MKAAAPAFLAAVLGFALPAGAAPVQNPGQSRAQSADTPGQSYDQKVGGPTTTKPGEQQAQLGSDRDRYCQDLQKRAKDLWNDAERSKDHGDFARSRDQLDQINAQLTRDCGK